MHCNYRPIALVPCLSKILEKLIDNRLANWLKKNRIIREEQGGFREGYSTVDRVFVLKALIEKYSRGKSNLLVAFVDFERAFDSVDRILLCVELLRIGLPRIFVRLVCDMYRLTRGMVKVAGKGFSDLFSCEVGVKQGSTLSPRLFCLYINDIVEFFEEKWAPTVSLGNLALSLLLFADDAALIARSAEDLQILLNILDVYLEKKKMRLNIQKTEIVVFGTNKNNDKFLFKVIELQKLQLLSI